jgi:hypothetical protein
MRGKLRESTQGSGTVAHLRAGVRGGFRVIALKQRFNSAFNAIFDAF